MTPEPTRVGGAGPAAGAGDASGDAGLPAASDLLRILLLEDNPADARLTRERLRGSAIDFAARHHRAFHRRVTDTSAELGFAPRVWRRGRRTS